MFDMLKNLGKIREIQQKMQQMQEEAARKQVSADAGGGIVTATVNGRLELVKIHIDKSKFDVNDTEMLEDLITAAVSAAQTKAAEMMKDEMTKMAGDLGLPPGMLPGQS
ncbi:MAG TPA: YbaB/EbfC family nucleoid-associated protein [Tepidisphaeraceae bacterium]|jgi:DNA-binding YbaB/EbfC family protein|nr:YbaB/EbfC family nucleoid-associated protein [Tepidisphaeraceae bacterium]